MASEVYMNVPAVRKMARNFSAISRVLKNVSKTLQNLSNILKSTAFVGLVGGMAVQSYINRYKPRLDQLARDSQEISKDLKDAADAYERGDAAGALRFH
jgi:uncharacterized protein YukE